MTTLEFSIIDPPSPDLQTLLDEFQAVRKVNIKIQVMRWETAWPKLLAFALYGRGPDVSHIGSTWASSLTPMNALREFSPREVDILGGAQAFVQPAWQSATVQGDPRVWSIPWASFTFLVLYRRDHLKAARIDAETAFDTPEHMYTAVKRLKENGAEVPIALPAGDPFLDRVHIASSWVWGAGGNYLSEDGKNALLTQPETRAGLKAFFELYRLMPVGQHKLSYSDTLGLFSEGKASVVIADCSFPHLVVQENPDFLMRIGVHALPGVPFVSGDNLIIWQVARQAPDKERAALDLVVFLTSRSAQTRFCQSLQQFPVRYDALEAITSPLESLAPVLTETFKTGRTHKPTMLWSRHEQMLGHAFDEITADVLSKTSMPIESILDIHLPSLQHRISLLMG